MCGVFAVISKKKKPLDKTRCLEAANLIYNRGPDSLKYEFFKNATLFISNTVLSITGEVTKSRKLTSSRRYSISFNGEIYNYKQLNNDYLKLKKINQISDTNVLLNLHETLEHSKIPIKLDGMFSYLIYDNKNNNIIISNDTQGEKNFYYFEDENFFIISSNIKSIITFIKKYTLNKITLKNYFRTRHFMSLQSTCFNKISIFSNGIYFTYNLGNNKKKISNYDNPLSWISEKKYNELQNYTEKDLIEYFDYKLNNQIKTMIPKLKFGCVISGGIDSTLQAGIISNHQQSKLNLVIDYGKKKDSIANNINLFDKYFKKKITKLTCNEAQYIDYAKKCYEIVCSPLHTHDLPGRYLLSKKFRENRCKVFFSADGCDEIYGGQQLYYDLFKKEFDYKKNHSPYSMAFDNFIEGEKNNPLDQYLDNKWREINKRYEFISCKKTRNILSSLFLDYFIQSISVANRSNDLVCCENSVEPRNVFIQKEILKIGFNLPFKYKINFKAKKKFQQKYLLKKLFTKYFDEKLIFPKKGFSGYPEALTTNGFKKINSLFAINSSKNKNKKYIDIKNLKRDLNWKLINSEKFINEHF